MKIKAIISSVASRTALACSMLSVFYPKEELAGKRLKDLDKKVIAAIAGNFKKGEAKISIKFCVEKKAKISIQHYMYQWFKNNYNPSNLFAHTQLV